MQKYGDKMQSKDILIENIDKIHTTEMGAGRRKNSKKRVYC